MEKQTTGKLTLLLTGIVARLEENFDYLIEIKGHFVSGTVQTPFSFIPEGGLLLGAIGAEKKTIPLDVFQETVLAEAKRQDAIIMKIIYRGETQVLESSPQMTRIKSLEQEVLSVLQTTGGSTGDSPKKKNTIYAQQANAIHDSGTSTLMMHRNYLVKPGEADVLLKEIGIMAENGKVRNDRIRKYNQIDHFVELLSPMIETLAKEKSDLFIVDCGCGKSYLSFVLNYYIREIMKMKAHILGIDIAEGVIASSRETARKLQYRNMDFYCGNIRELFIDGEGPVKRQPDLVISLHACDVATDYALAFGMRNGARAIVSVPCCHHEFVGQMKNEGLLEDLLRFGPLKARFADTLTDSLRMLMLEAAGYEVSCVEWVSPLETPKNLMIRANQKTEGNEDKRKRVEEIMVEYHLRFTLYEEMRGFLGNGALRIDGSAY